MPDGWVAGDVSAEGELELSLKAFAILKRKAQEAGSWRGIEPQDFMFYAKAGDEEARGGGVRLQDEHVRHS